MAQRLACRLYARFLCAYALSADDICPEDYLENCVEPLKPIKNILNGNADLIFVAQPSTAQSNWPIASGVKLVYTPCT